MENIKKLILRPKDWECTIAECPPGPFVFDGDVGFKTAYRHSGGHSEVFCSNGDAFWGGKTHKSDVDQLKVIPAEYRWSNEH